jgi:uncharacterized Rmd1/YagE family protein
LKDTILKDGGSIVYRDALYLQKEFGEIFIFHFGVIVAWGLPGDESKKIINEMKFFAEDPHPEVLIDEFTYTGKNDQMRIHQDHIHLTDGELMEKLAVSYGIAQSLKLTELEMYVQQTIKTTRRIPDNIAATGRSMLTRREIARMRGKLFLVRSDISLNFELLDTPEFFWDFPEVEHVYLATSKYLDVASRIEVLNKKLVIIQELLNMLADERNHKHSARLEWIIIWLIFVEVAYFFINEFIK